MLSKRVDPVEAMLSALSISNIELWDSELQNEKPVLIDLAKHFEVTFTHLLIERKFAVSCCDPDVKAASEIVSKSELTLLLRSPQNRSGTNQNAEQYIPRISSVVPKTQKNIIDWRT